jgi:WD repeat-containing protein 23
MSASQSPTSEQNDPRTISYDPTDPFWRDTDEDDDDDMNSAFEYAPGEEEEEEDEEEGEYYFHGPFHQRCELAPMAITYQLGQMPKNS